MKFRVLHEYWGDEGWECEARGVVDAAEKFAEHFNSEFDYSLLDGKNEIVTIVDPHGVRTRWSLSAELVHHYSATPLTDEREAPDV